MKERQRWQPEEDDLLKAYVNQYGPKEWNLISHRMPKPLNRHPKSCLDRWKNYLKPGIKKGSLTPDEQSLVISLQSKYGNKWKKIAAQLPGRTAKRLGKWWEVFKEKQSKLKNVPLIGDKGKGSYDHILDTFAEKYVQPKIGGVHIQTLMPDPDPVLSLGLSSFSTTTPAASATPSPSAILTRFMAEQDMGTLIQYWKEVEEGRQNWMQQKKEARWRLSRVEQQLEAEKWRKRREKMEEIEMQIRCLREEEMGFMSRIENDYREQLNILQRDAENKEAKLIETWSSKHAKMVKLVEQIRVVYSGGDGGCGSGGGGGGGGFNNL